MWKASSHARIVQSDEIQIVNCRLFCYIVRYFLCMLLSISVLNEKILHVLACVRALDCECMCVCGCVRASGALVCCRTEGEHFGGNEKNARKIRSVVSVAQIYTLSMYWLLY